jgi:hypothetical protein
MAATSPFTSAGTTIALDQGTAPATYNQAGYEAGGMVYVSIGEISDAGDFGREYALVTFNSLANRRTTKRKGSYNDGQMTLQLARVPSDVGQADLIAALASDASSAFRVTLQDGSKLYFMGQVLSYTTNVGTTDQITGATCVVEITHDIIEVPSP